jgi:hypothetical protein
VWGELVEQFSGEKHTYKTVENRINELVRFGALHRVGQYKSRRVDTRALRPTPLGRAWLDRSVLPLPTDPPTDE